jgi:hypothetical protein
MQQAAIIQSGRQSGLVSHFNIQILSDRPFSGSQPLQIPKRGFD